MKLSFPQKMDFHLRLGGQISGLRSLPTHVMPHRPNRRRQNGGVCVATGSAMPAPTPMQEPTPHSNAKGVKYTLACPICQTTQFEITKRNGKMDIGGLNIPHCPRCQRQFGSIADSSAMKILRYVDLTLTSGVTPRAYKQRSWNGTELFRNPLVSVAYERGWRQSFAWAGFPGVDVESKMAIDFLSPAHGEVIIDMSCGSGLFSRRFLSSGKFAGVVAADFSESMLEEAYRNFTTGTTTTTTTTTRLNGDASTPGELDQNEYLLLRADVARLPFTTGSVAGIHAGAALHCWPNPQAAMAEISRVLKPGGVFVASTFLTGTAALGQLLGNDDLVRPLRGIESVVGSSSAYRWWEEDEIRDLCDVAGLQSFKRERKNRFIMFCVSKPLFNS